MISQHYNIVLGSKSPRRREILTLAGLSFRLVEAEHEEEMPEHPFFLDDIPLYLAEQKAHSLLNLREKHEILLTADTLVFLGEEIIGKPRDRQDAFDILQRLSGRMHRVISGVCLVTDKGMTTLTDTTEVYFKLLDLRDIEYYLEHHNVLDKAGAYGIQDWIGLIGIEKINGSYFNVMGLPIHKVYEALIKLSNH